MVSHKINTVGSSTSISASSYWSWTFTLSLFPFFIVGCPCHLLTLKNASAKKIATPAVVYSTKTWFFLIFSLQFGIIALIVSIFLLIATLIINAYVVYEVSGVIDYLFIRAQYTADTFWDVIFLLRYLPIVVPLDYIWLRGYKIRNMIQEFDHLHAKYHGYGTSSVKARIRVVIMILFIFVINTIQIFAYLLESVEAGNTVWEKVEIVIEAILDLVLCFLIPLYCTFCYAVKFQLLIVKALVYKWIHERVTPSVHHLNQVKQLYTEATNNIVAMNAVFSLYLSVALSIIIVDTLRDSENFWKGIFKVLGGGGIGIMSFVGPAIFSGNDQEIGAKEGGETASELTSADVRQINADIAGILMTYFLIYFMVRQAVATNDTAREINCWLNDFVVGGSGTCIIGILKEMGVDIEDKDGNGTAIGTLGVLDRRDTPIWAKTSKSHDDTDDEFIKKFQMLKAYIHVRMQTEKPALLGIALVGLLVPSLSGRLRRYRVLF